MLAERQTATVKRVYTCATIAELLRNSCATVAHEIIHKNILSEETGVSVTV